MSSPPTTPVWEEWTWNTATRDGTPIKIRPLRRDDERREIAFIESLSDQTRYFRMFTPLKVLTPEMLNQFMNVDYDRRMALVATVGEGEQEKFIGVARYGATDRPGEVEIGVTVTDAWQRRGIATLLMRALIRFARDHGFKELSGVVLPENRPMLALAHKLGFTIHYDPDSHLMKISQPLGDSRGTGEST